MVHFVHYMCVLYIRQNNPTDSVYKHIVAYLLRCFSYGMGVHCQFNSVLQHEHQMSAICTDKKACIVKPTKQMETK